LEILPKQLRQAKTGRLFTYSEGLAKRNDMIPVWSDGVDPNVAPEGLSIDNSKSEKLRERIVELEEENINLSRRLKAITDQNKNQTDAIRNLRDNVNKLTDDNVALNVQIDKLKAKLAVSVPVSAGAAPPRTDRMKVITDAVRIIYSDNREDDFTGSGDPRISAVEARCGLNDVTAAERDQAVSAIKG
jgi:regulator of replication initiation timing